MQSKSNKPRIISIANQKGGVGKTTTAVNLAAALAMRGKKTLLIDLDPQGNASTGLGIAHEDREKSSYDVLRHGLSATGVAIPTYVANLSILPATSDLASVDIEIQDDPNKILRLKNALEHVSKSDFEYILIDCPPSLNLLTLNAFSAGSGVLVPLQSEFFALEGLSQLILTVRKIRETVNSKLMIEGIVLTMFDRRNNLSQQVEADVRESLNEMVYKTIIPRNVRISESPSFGKTAIDYDSDSPGAKAYLALADEFLKRAKK